MKEKELNVNNSKKLIVGVSIVFCTIILIIGTTIAYFIQSDTKETGEIVSTDEVTLEYNDDNNNYMLGDLIPLNETDIEKAYNNKCKDSNNYNVCSIYRFTISNTSDVTQKLVINMIPTLNSFHNLKYNIYEINNEVSNNIKKNQELKYDDKTPITLFDNLKLDNGSSKTYELVFYINNNPNANQNIEDAGKNFGAQITVNSVTTGEYVSKSIGESCYKVKQIGTENTDTTYYSETIDEKYYGSYILTEFYGIDEEKKEPVEGCGITQDGDGFYSVTVPSKIGDKEIKIMGSHLFQALDVETMNINEYVNIKRIDIEEGIEIIEAGSENGIFLSVGYDVKNNIIIVDDLQINLPSTLEEIGDFAFYYSSLKNINIPKNVKSIGNYAFSSIKSLETINFQELSELTIIGYGAFGQSGLKKISLPKGLTTIENLAFSNCNLTYTNQDAPLVIPSSVTTIGASAFSSYANGTDLNPQNRYLNYIKFNGTLTAGNIDWYTSVENGGATIEILK